MLLWINLSKSGNFFHGIQTQNFPGVWLKSCSQRKSQSLLNSPVAPATIRFTGNKEISIPVNSSFAARFSDSFTQPDREPANAWSRRLICVTQSSGSPGFRWFIANINYPFPLCDKASNLATSGNCVQALSNARCRPKKKCLMCVMQTWKAELSRCC